MLRLVDASGCLKIEEDVRGSAVQWCCKGDRFRGVKRKVEYVIYCMRVQEILLMSCYI